MAKDLDPSTKTLGTFFCFVLIAYIFYHLGRWSAQLQTSAYVDQAGSCDRPCCREAGTTSTEQKTAARIEEVDQTENEVYQDITKSAKWFDLFAQKALRDTKELEKNMRKDLEKWDEERRREMLRMKGLREEQLRWLWDSKRKGERNIFAWFAGGKKKGLGDTPQKEVDMKIAYAGRSPQSEKTIFTEQAVAVNKS